MEQKEYINIILTGLIEANTTVQEYSNYLIQKQRISEKESFVKKNTFFQSCERALAILEGLIAQRKHSFSSEYNEFMVEAAKGNVDFDGEDPEEVKKQMKEQCEYAKKHAEINLFMDLRSFDLGKEYKGRLKEENTNFIKEGIEEAVIQGLTYEEKGVNKEPLLLNKFERIFKNDIGYNIFVRMNNHYFPRENHLANYSFLFVALKKYVVCRNIDFVKFLASENGVFIDKIDSRQVLKGNGKNHLFKQVEKEVIQLNTNTKHT